MRLRVFHTTRYEYPTPASDSHNEVRLMPVSDAQQTCHDFKLTTVPAAKMFWYDLPTGRVHHFNIRRPHSSLAIYAEASVFVHRGDPFRTLAFDTDDLGFYAQPGVCQRYAEYLMPTRYAPFVPGSMCLMEMAEREAGRGAASLLIGLNRLMFREFTYDPNATEVSTPLADVIEHRRGVCQDFTHLMLSLCRQRGIPARYASGYILSRRAPAPEEGSDMVQLLGAEAMHAWVECLLPTRAGEAWIGFDPTNGILANDSYIKVHVGRDYSDVPPLRGVFNGLSAGKLDVTVRVVEDE